ncbi:hypothetical protein BLNAU_14196 [Blattamonas nauphoetae]|uniref:Uncharacterized protein n=1 Tax=Blattamonas nauphoetae TaxID=2049346 RepID=A0ABQ9XHI1_9EUKA|nr:hypothetical protein BLNAU_14196 [Blattamonas nauphoetae]
MCVSVRRGDTFGVAKMLQQVLKSFLFGGEAVLCSNVTATSFPIDDNASFILKFTRENEKTVTLPTINAIPLPLSPAEESANVTQFAEIDARPVTNSDSPCPNAKPGTLVLLLAVNVVWRPVEYAMVWL